MDLACEQVPDGKALADPPLLRLEGEACHAYLSMLLHLNTAASEPLQEAADVERRLMQLCIANLRCFQVWTQQHLACIATAFTSLCVNTWHGVVCQTPVLLSGGVSYSAPSHV